MLKVKINLKQSGWTTFAQMSAGQEETGLISVSNIVLALNSSGVFENSNCTAVFENISRRFTNLTAPDSPDRFLKGREIEVIDNDEIIFKGKISETPEPSPFQFTIRADVFTGMYDTEINKKIRRAEFLNLPKENKRQYSNVVLGKAEAPGGALKAYRVDDNLFLASWHFLYSLLDAWKIENNVKIKITSSCTLQNDPATGYAFIYYESNADVLELYFNCLGGYKSIYDTGNKLTDGPLETWNTTTDLTYWNEVIRGSSTVNKETSDVKEGTACARLDIDADNKQASIDQDVVLNPDKKAKISFWYKNSTTGKTAELVFKDTGLNVFLKEDGTWTEENYKIELPSATEWTFYEIEIFLPTEYTEYNIKLNKFEAADSSIYIDDVQIIKERKELITNPADMLSFLVENFSDIPLVSASVENAWQIFDERNYLDLVIAINDGTVWKKFFQLFTENFDSYINHTISGLEVIALDWGKQEAALSVDSIYIDWESFKFWPDDTQVYANVQAYYDYSPLEKIYNEQIEDIENETGHEGEEKEILLRYHTDRESALDIAGRIAFRRKNPPVKYTVQLPFIIGKKISPGQVVNLSMKDGYFPGQNRLCQVFRKRRENEFYVFIMEDIQLINEGVIILWNDGNPDKVELKNENDINCHSLL